MMRLDLLKILFLLAIPAMASAQFTYPKTQKIEHNEVLHGQTISDPYRWLEQDVRTTPAVADWVKSQNDVTFTYLSLLKHKNPIQKRLTELWNYERYSTPFKIGGRYYFYKNDGLQNQAVLYMQETLESPPQVLLDPNLWSKDGTVALAGTSFSPDGRYLAYGIQDAGSDWSTWSILRIDPRTELPDKIQWVKYSQPEWTPDGLGFFYGAFDAPKEGAAYQSVTLGMKLYYHRIGQAQADDVLVHSQPDQPEWGFAPGVTEDGRYLIITVWKGTSSKYRVRYRDLWEPYAQAVDLIDTFDHEFSFIGNDGPTFYFKTDKDAPRGRVFAINIKKPQPENWKEILPQTADTLESVSMIGGMLVAQYMKDAHTELRLYSMQGTFVRSISLPGLGTVYGLSGKFTDMEMFYSFQNFITPQQTFRYNMITGQSTLFNAAKVQFDAAPYEVKQVFFSSKDGTKVPMFLVHKKDLALDGQNPTLMYGYGGFASAENPYYSSTTAMWLEMGGVYVVVSLRGGNEYGEEWHQAGTKLKKQNVFDDFIAAAEFLIAEKYTKPSKLAIMGRSNGGLLVGACMTQRPELFGVALPAVGVMDMLRFHKFTAGRFWTDDYGSPENPEEFKALLAYSPYHNLKKGVNYPATLITTADTDDRVVPGHSFKFAAALQEAQTGAGPVLIRIETRAGHGSGKPTDKLIAERTDELAFAAHNLGMQPMDANTGSGQ